jgi:hypothetical protein
MTGVLELFHHTPTPCARRNDGRSEVTAIANVYSFVGCVEESTDFRIS